MLDHGFIVCLGFTIAYSVLTTLWCYNWFKHRHSTKGIPLHLYIGFTVLLELLLLLCATLYYRDPENSYGIGIAANILYVLTGVIFQSLLILIGLGWCIVKMSLPMKHVIAIAVFVVAKILLEIGNFGLFRKQLGDKLWTFNLFFVLFINLGVLVFVVTATVANIRKLSDKINADAPSQDVVDNNSSSSVTSIPLQDVPKHNNDQNTPNEETKDMHKEETQNEEEETQETHGETEKETDPDDMLHIPEAHEKLKLFNFFYKFFFVYIAATAIIKFIGDSAIREYTEYTIQFMFLAGLCYVFRLREANQYFFDWR